MDYSQHGEQVIIERFFNGAVGRFLDVGAHDGRINSNTARLVDMGWGGVLVEPSPWVFPYLARRYQHKEQIQLVNAAMDVHAQLVEWHDCGGDQLSTTEPSHRQIWERDLGVKYQKFYIATITFDMLAHGLNPGAVSPGAFHFISIDTEGSNDRIVDACLKRYRPQLVCVERGAGVTEALFRHQYLICGETAGNLLAKPRGT